ncbi:hypothetical protein CAEBREN_01068 [Caenorhabditis brenneri]|uniref:F-box associated domain-containing protein n=1 Tax=Caenorhabditis brenneri TaxID=135651 RepID=G0PJI1_CAEBE|nr:hypothetical protein CAEBREN_01068 [Caenorhabditis brenneri]
MFPSSNLILSFYSHKMKSTNIKDILSNPLFREWKFLRVFGKQIEQTDLELIIDMAESNRKISIQLEKFPVDFRHEKVLEFKMPILEQFILQAFEFSEIEYDVADWVRIEDLFSLRNSSIVTLCHNEFNCSELNELICFWKNCNYSMFRQLTIHMKQEIVFATNMIFDEIVYLETFRNGRNEYILLSHHCDDVERPLAVISWMGSSFQMLTIGREEYPDEFETLKTIVSKEIYKLTNRRLEFLNKAR